MMRRAIVLLLAVAVAGLRVPSPASQLASGGQLKGKSLGNTKRHRSLMNKAALRRLVVSRWEKQQAHEHFDFIVRYAVFGANHGPKQLEEAISRLRSSLCLAERNLAPVVRSVLSSSPSYVLYTDRSTNALVSKLLLMFPNITVNKRVRLVNLDRRNAEDEKRMSEFRRLGLGDEDLASVRMLMADGAYLPTSAGRLLLSTDVSFLQPAKLLVEEALRLQSGQALYMVDDKTWGGVRYTLPGFKGPQCPGLLSGMVFLTPGLEITSESLVSKMRWYSEQPVAAERTMPECLLCLDQDLSSGLHAIADFGLMMAVGEASGGPENCHPISSTQYQYLPSSKDRPFLEATQDHSISECWP
mmetsp:Transcript_36436/g.79705  ORF Transcript_36436/g.79705 Transcript_36436/m.79705 type:complete len:357 (+) Transcript_36436:34-1104(+)|eukprot:CAMPEP_0170606030 /NCGR_PEP_ID=MMETSP0224-20130122/20289_1 /TAXON_ID=285029 /ORGANISM="Togula jolla, Strain CCCM 725" /LENGTH=356 /DNA_ID=CAMNT_0010931073 /DNA_START=34 /DNA_END=1104 /DNA_ORIENTATION=+